MAFSSGFFNSVEHDRRYDALQVSQMFDGLIRDGVFASIGTCFVVTQNHGFVVNVGIGRAWFNHTWSYNDSIMPVELPMSEILMNRIDAVVLEVNSSEGVRQNSIKVLKGTPGTNPAKPNLTKSKYVNQYPLAYITQPEGSAAIDGRYIENCVGTSACPFVTGILDVISIDELLPQWRYELNHFMDQNKKDYQQWFSTIVAAYDENWETFLRWEQSAQNQVMSWFNEIKGKLGSDIAVNLQMQLDRIAEKSFNYYAGIVSGTTEYKNGNKIYENLTDVTVQTTVSKNGSNIVIFTTTIRPINSNAIYTKTTTTTNATTSRGYLIDERYTVEYSAGNSIDLQLGQYTGTADMVAEFDNTNYDVQNATKSKHEEDTYIIE